MVWMRCSAKPSTTHALENLPTELDGYTQASARLCPPSQPQSLQAWDPEEHTSQQTEALELLSLLNDNRYHERPSRGPHLICQ